MVRGGLGEGSKDLIGLALAIGDLPGLHQGEAGRGRRGDALGSQGFLDGGIDLAQRAVVAAGPCDGGGAQFGGEAGDFLAGIAGGANEFYAVVGKVAGEGVEGTFAPPRGRAAQRAGAGIGRLVEDDGDQGDVAKRGGLGRAGKGLVIVQAQVIAEPHEAGHGGHPTRRKRRFGETAGGEVVFSTKFERPHHGRVKVHRRPLVIHFGSKVLHPRRRPTQETLCDYSRHSLMSRALCSCTGLLLFRATEARKAPAE